MALIDLFVYSLEQLENQFDLSAVVIVLSRFSSGIACGTSHESLKVIPLKLFYYQTFFLFKYVLH